MPRGVQNYTDGNIHRVLKFRICGLIRKKWNVLAI